MSTFLKHYKCDNLYATNSFLIFLSCIRSAAILTDSSELIENSGDDIICFTGDLVFSMEIID